MEEKVPIISQKEDPDFHGPFVVRLENSEGLIANGGIGLKGVF